MSRESLQNTLGGARDGTSAAEILRAAREQGLRTSYETNATVEQLASVPVPAILHWNENHFVVLEISTRDSVRIIDPSQGARRLSWAAVAENFGGVVLMFEKSEGFEPCGPARAWRHRKSEALLRRRPHLIAIGVFSLIIVAMGLAQVFLTARLIDARWPGETPIVPSPVVLGICLFAALLLQCVVLHVRNWMLADMRAGLDQELMPVLMERLLAKPPAFFLNTSPGQLLEALERNWCIGPFGSSWLANGVVDALMMPLIVAALAWISIPLSISTVAAALLFGLAVFVLERFVGSADRWRFERHMMVIGRVREFFNGIESIKAERLESAVFKSWRNEFEQQVRSEWKHALWRSTADACQLLLITGVPLLFLILCVPMISRGTLTPGAWVASYLLIVWLIKGAGTLALKCRPGLESGSLDQLDEIYSEAPIVPARSVPAGGQLEGRLEVDHLTFRYGPHSPPVLHDLSFIIEPGELVVIAGESGSGKTTLLKVLLGLYAWQGSAVRYGGRVLDEISPQVLQHQVGAYLPPGRPMHGTLAEVIADDNDVDRDQIARAVCLAELKREIEAMPLGYDTVIHSEQTGFSAGQRQRLMLARLLAKQPRILFLDGLFDLIDPATTANILRNIKGCGITCLIVSSQPAVAEQADKRLTLTRYDSSSVEAP